MAEFRKITEELDFLQKKVASLREVYKLYPDTIITRSAAYESPSLNRDANTIRFSYEREVVWAHISKVFGCVEVHTKPSKFAILVYDPFSLFTHLMVQEYRENMKKNEISEDLIRKADLYVIEFIGTKNINIKNSNLDTLRNDDLKKLLILK
jgi:hypothetical protein